MNSLHISVHPKRRNLSNTRMGQAFHLLTASRFNDGILRSTEDILDKFNLKLGSVGRIVLEKQQHKRERDASRKQTIKAKAGQRKASKDRRSSRDSVERDGTYEAGMGLLDDRVHVDMDECVETYPDDDALKLSQSMQATPVIRVRNATHCGNCGIIGHNKRTCPSLAIAPTPLCAPSSLCPMPVVTATPVLLPPGRSCSLPIT